MVLSDSDNTDIILDFFSGSGTTAQAVLEYNLFFESNCKYILVQLPEYTDEKSEAYKAGYRKISDITIERVKRVIGKMEKEQSDNPDLFKDNKIDLGFKVYHLTKSAFPRVEFVPDPDKTNDENVELFKKYIKDKEATMYSLFEDMEIIDEVLLKNGFMLNYKKTDFNINSVETHGNASQQRIFHVKDDYKEALLCLDEALKNETVEYFKTNKDIMFICLERALDTTKKWNLKHFLGDKLVVF
jgi:adenine-specific DNA-methyltransferase